MLRPHNATPRVKLLHSKRVVVMPTALQTMQLIVQLSDKEVGWLGRVREIENILVLTDIYLFHQEVAHTTCEITAAGLTEFAMELLEQPGGDEVYNEVRLWGHSHVNMGVSPSGQDEKQMGVFETSGHPWFLRCIANKKGDMQFTLFDFDSGIIVEDMPWEVYMPTPVGLEEQIAAELKAKVKPLVYPVRQWYNSPTPAKPKGTPLTAAKTEGAPRVTQAQRQADVDDEEDYDYEDYAVPFGADSSVYFDSCIETDEDVEDLFGTNELIAIGCTESYGEAMELIEKMEPVPLSPIDRSRVWRYARALTA